MTQSVPEWTDLRGVLLRSHRHFPVRMGTRRRKGERPSGLTTTRTLTRSVNSTPTPDPIGKVGEGQGGERE